MKGNGRPRGARVLAVASRPQHASGSPGLGTWNRTRAALLAVTLGVTVGACSLAGPARGSGGGDGDQSPPAEAGGPPGDDRPTEEEARPGADQDEARRLDEARNDAFACAPSTGQEMVEFLNVLREDEGLGPLSADLRLIEAARRHARDLARNDLMGHEGSDGSTPAERATRAGYGWTFVAENVAGGQRRAGEVVRGWMRSSGHRANILDQRARHVGVGFIRQEGSQYRTYWVAVFGATEDSVVAVKGGCHP